jgi:hypothetical protein
LNHVPAPRPTEECTERWLSNISAESRNASLPKTTSQGGIDTYLLSS